MKILKVTSSGVNRLIDAYKTMREENKSMKFGSKSSEFFENMEISLVLSDLKGIELLVLKKFCPSLIVLDNDNTTFINEPKKITTTVLRTGNIPTNEDKARESELLTLSDKIFSIFKFIRNTNPEKESSDLYGMFDIGSYRFKVIARFEGVNIISLLNAFPEYVLFNNKTSSFMEEGTKEFENLCGQQFIMNFYSYMNDALSSFDVAVDSEFDKHFLSFASKNNNVVCTHIRNPIAEINMLSYENSTELIRDIRAIKADSRFIDYPMDKEDSLIYHYAICSSVDTLLKFISFSNTVYFYSDLKGVAGNKTEPDLPSDINTESAISFLDACEALDNWRIEAFKNSETEDRTLGKNAIKHYSKLELFNFIPRGAQIKFMIRGTSKELKAFIDKMNREKYVYVNFELKSIFDIIENNIKLMDMVWNM